MAFGFKFLLFFTDFFMTSKLSWKFGKGQFSFQSQQKAMPKNVQTTVQLNSSHMLAK